MGLNRERSVLYDSYLKYEKLQKRMEDAYPPQI